MKIKLIFILFTILYSSLSTASSVYWELYPMSLNIYSENFNIQSVEVIMSCTLSDGSELFSEYKEVEVPSVLTVSPNFAGNGQWYELETDGAYLKASQIFADLKDCQAKIRVVSDVIDDGSVGNPPLSGYISLVFASGSEEAVQEFVEMDQAALIEEVFSEGLRLKIHENGFYIGLVE